MDRPIAYSYIRFSTPEQARGDSLRRQMEMSEAYAKANGLELDTEMRFLDAGVSSFRGKNATEGALSRFINLVKTGKIAPGSYLLVEAFDRLSRDDVDEALHLLLDLIRSGITVVTLMDGQKISREILKADPIGAMFRLMRPMMQMAEAHHASLQKSKRVREYFDDRRKSLQDGKRVILSTCTPAWLRVVRDEAGKCRAFELIPERAEIVRNIFEMSATEGLGVHKIAMILTAEGIPTWGGNGRRAEQWSKNYVQKILSNPAVIGEFQPHVRDADGKKVPSGEPIADYFPAAISKELWQRAADAKESRQVVALRGAIGKNVSNIFTGLIRCGYSGLRYYHKNCGGGRYCLVSHGQAPDGHFPSWVYDDLEFQILRFVEMIDLPQILGKPAESECLAIRKQIGELETGKGRLDAQLARLAEALMDDGKPLRTVQAAISKAETEQDALRSEIAAAQRELERLERMASGAAQSQRDLGEMMQRRDDPQIRLRLKAELRRVIKRITIWPSLPVDEPKSVYPIANAKQLAEFKERLEKGREPYKAPLTKAKRRLSIVFVGGEVKHADLTYQRTKRKWKNVGFRLSTKVGRIVTIPIREQTVPIPEPTIRSMNLEYDQRRKVASGNGSTPATPMREPPSA